MGCSHVADHTPKGISSAEYTTCLYSEARKAREAPSRGAHCSGPSPSTECLSSSVCHLRAGFSALLVRRTARKRRPPCAGDSLREDRGWQNRVGVGGRPQEFLRELESRVDAPLCRAPSRRSASDQFDPALAEGRCA